ncbi:MAG: lytic transglycosylase domain-containing protein [archaeon]|nr:lytic transglycosylase domain-containing protein [archaeon]
MAKKFFVSAKTPERVGRRTFLKVAGASIAGAFFGKRSRAQEPVAVEKSAEHLFRNLPDQVPQKKKLLVFQPGSGLKGEAIAKAYNVKFTPGPNFEPSSELVHDVKMLVARECSRYNRIIEGFNPKGEQLVNPYRALAILFVESSFNPNAHKQGDGRGIAQLTGIAMKDLKMLEKFPVEVVDPFDMEQSIAGMVRYLAHLNRAYFKPSERTAENIAAAYRLGPSGMSNPSNKQIFADYIARVAKAQKRFEAERVLEGY